MDGLVSFLLLCFSVFGFRAVHLLNEGGAYESTSEREVMILLVSNTNHVAFPNLQSVKANSKR
jgi:predicted ABC-type sugar transport system permease subunit